MPPHGDDPQRRQGEEPRQYGTGRPHGPLDATRQELREEADELLRRSPLGVGVGKDGAEADRDAVGDEEDETGAQRRGAAPRERSQALEGGEGPSDAQDRQHHRAQPEHLPQHAPDLAAPAPGQRELQEGQTEEQAQQQCGDADQLVAGLLIHAVMRRSAYTGTTVNRSGRAQKDTSSPRPVSTSWRAASLRSNASSQPPCCPARSSETCAASLRLTFRVPFFTVLM